MPKISVIMPVYNAERYIKIAVDSIINQTFKDFELIVIDDKGTDDSIKIVEEISDSRIRILHNEKNCGIAFSRNRGITEAKGEYLALMDDDDYAPDYRLEMENRFLDAHKDVAVVGGARHIIDEKNNIVKYNSSLMIHNPKRVRAELIFHDVIPNGSSMMRKKFIQDNGIQYKDNMYGMEDYHFWVQCSLYGNIVNLSDVLLYWRKTDNNETHRQNEGFMQNRIDTFRSIQRYALEKNGFTLTRKELDCFFREFSESMKRIPTINDINELFTVLSKLISQAKGVSFSKEMEYVCKYMFSKRIAKSDIWNG